MDDNRLDVARQALGTDVVDDFLAKFGMGPKYVPTERKTYTCPKCRGHRAYYEELHADTDMDEILLYCPDCGRNVDN